MSRPFSTSLVQFDAYPLAPQENLQRIVELVRLEAQAGARLIVFPELCNTGYVEPLMPGMPFTDPARAHDYAFELHQASEGIEGPYTQALRSLAQELQVHLIVGLATQHAELKGCLYNSSVLFGPDGSVQSYHKIHRWHLEKLYFVAGDRISVNRTPLGKLGMQICYDIRFPEVTRVMTLQGAEIVTNIWASFREERVPMSDPQTFIHRSYTRAIENGVFFLSCNRSGRHGGCRFMGHSCIVAPDGRVVAASDSEDFDIVRGVVDLDEVVRYRAYVGLFTDRRPDLYGDFAETPDIAPL